jgi:hypothetical protein
MGSNQIPFEIFSSTPIIGTGKNMVQLLLQVQIPELTFQSFSIVQAKSIPQAVKVINFDRQKLQITTPFWKITLNTKGGISGPYQSGLWKGNATG